MENLSVLPDSPSLIWNTLTKDATEKHNRPFISAKSHSNRMERCGFTGITQNWKMWPFYNWHPKEFERKVGWYCLLAMKSTLMSYYLALLTKYMDMTREEVDYCPIGF